MKSQTGREPQLQDSTPAKIGEIPSTDEEVGMDTTQNSSDNKSSKFKEARDKKAYRWAINYCSRYVDRNPSQLTDKELQRIRTNLKFVRKFESNYPNATLRELPISRIPTHRTETAGSPCSSGKEVNGPRQIPKKAAKKKKKKLKSSSEPSELTQPSSSQSGTEEIGPKQIPRKAAKKKKKKKKIEIVL